MKSDILSLIFDIPANIGAEPLVVARGGASGMFPESSNLAYQYALATSLPSVAIFCDLQLTKDEIGICQSSLKLENETDIKLKIPDGEKTYDVNGEEIHGWFALDYPVQQLILNVTCKSSNIRTSNATDTHKKKWYT